MRELKNLTRKQAADLLQVSERSYADIENENVNITLKKLCDLCGVFECDICSLLEFSEQRVFNFSVNNNGNQGHNINHQGATNEMRLIESLMQSKDEIIQSKELIIQGLKRELNLINKKM